MCVDQSVDEKRLEEYQNRVSEWIGEQGIFFQLRYAGIVGNYSIMKQLGNLFIKLAVCIVALIGISYFFLNRHFGTDHYRESLSEQISEVLGVDEIEVVGFTRARGQGTFREINLSGGEGSFFMEGNVESMVAPFNFLSGISEKWAPNELNISRASFQLKAGGEEDEMQSAFTAILKTFDHENLESVKIEKLSIDWGYSKLTYGAIEESSFLAIYNEGVWEVTLEGGTFSQNWLQNFDLKSAKLLVTSTGVEVKSLKLALDDGTLDLSGFIGGTLGFPEFDLSGVMNNLPIAQLIQLPGVRVRDFIAGSISGDLAITGSTNRRIITTGKVSLVAPELITIRERWEILKTMSVLDINSSYRRVDFDRGEFEFTTSGGGLEINGLSLRAGDLIQLKGDLVSTLPTQKEAADALGIVLTSGFSDGMKPDYTDTSSAQALENDRMTLKRVTGGGKVNDLRIEVEGVNNQGTGQQNLSLTPKELEAQRLRYEMNVHRIQGELLFGVTENSLINYPSLQQLYPADDDGWRWLPLNFQTTFSKISQMESQRLLDDSRIRIEKTPGAE